MRKIPIFLRLSFFSYEGVEWETELYIFAFGYIHISMVQFKLNYPFSKFTNYISVKI